MADCLSLKKSNCKNCYKCIRHCPVKSIRFSGDQAHVIDDECVYCGQCFVICPQEAKEIVSEKERVLVLLQSGEPVIASIAPSFIAYFDGVGIESMREALQQLGFADAEETAIGATIVKREYDRILREEKKDVLISSCCHSINVLIRRYFPQLIPYLADVVTPMRAHCQDIKSRHPEAKTVFIGPCIAKKDEAQHSDDQVDAVLTYKELEEWFREENITLKQETIPNPKSRTRLFPTPGGILKTMALDAPDYQYMAIDGLNGCIGALKDLEKGNIHNAFIEMSACTGSCIGGPVMEKYHHRPLVEYLSVCKYAGDEDFDVAQPAASLIRKPHVVLSMHNQMPWEDEIKKVLHEMGKYDPSQELNCGTCGYDTCRDKAIAVCQGKANISMCLPFLKEKAEGFSDTVFNNSPNGLFVLNEDLEIQQINAAALKMMNLRAASDVLGDPIVRIMNPLPFMNVKNSGKGIYNERLYLAEYSRYVEQTIFPAQDSRMIICILRDVTEEEKAHSKKDEISRQTLEVADQVVEKQMRIVQEIASLLGETAAETKIALSKLKESINDE